MGQEGQVGVGDVPPGQLTLVLVVNVTADPVVKDLLRPKGVLPHRRQAGDGGQLVIGDRPLRLPQGLPDGGLHGGGGELHCPGGGGLPGLAGGRLRRGVRRAQQPGPRTQDQEEGRRQGQDLPPPPVRFPCQGRGEGGGILESVLRGEGHRLFQRLSQARRNFCLLQLLPVIVPGEGPDQGHAQGVQVRAPVGLGVAVLLRRGGGAGTHAAGVRVLAVLKLAGDAEVDEAHLPVGQEDDVLRLDVPVDHRGLLAVEDRQQGAELLPQGDAQRLRTAVLPLPPLGQGLSRKIGAQQAVHSPRLKLTDRLGHRAGQQGTQPL